MVTGMHMVMTSSNDGSEAKTPKIALQVAVPIPIWPNWAKCACTHAPPGTFVSHHPFHRGLLSAHAPTSPLLPPPLIHAPSPTTHVVPSLVARYIDGGFASRPACVSLFVSRRSINCFGLWTPGGTPTNPRCIRCITRPTSLPTARPPIVIWAPAASPRPSAVSIPEIQIRSKL